MGGWGDGEVGGEEGAVGAYWMGAAVAATMAGPRLRTMRLAPSRRSTVLRSLEAMRATSCWRRSTFMGPVAPLAAADGVLAPPGVAGLLLPCFLLKAGPFGNVSRAGAGARRLSAGCYSK